MPDAAGAGPTLFRQIARRLVFYTLIFALLDVGIVIATYSRHPESLAQQLLNLEAERVATLADPAGAPVPPGIENWSARLLPPPGSADAELIDETRRERIAGGYRISGVRPLTENPADGWIMLRFDTIGVRAFVPVILHELRDHVAVPLVPLSVLLLMFNIGAVRRTLAPLRRAEDEANRLDPDNLASRLTVPRAPREVGTLVRAFNGALQRVETAMTTLRDFTANAAHEMRTPLAIMQLSLDRLPDGPIKTELQADTDHMTRLVGQMLDLAQADAFLNDDPAAVDLAAVGRAVIRLLAPKSFATGRELIFADYGDTVVDGHAEAIFRVYRNLIDNALAHAPGTRPIEIAAGPGPQFSVRDHGPGIAAADRPLLFERFWRKDRSHSQGAGLGLGIVKRLVDVHGGRIDIEMPKDGGTLFRVTFPVPASIPAAMPATTAPATPVIA